MSVSGVASHRNQRCLKPGAPGSGLLIRRQGQHFREFAPEVDTKPVAIGHQTDLVDEPADDLARFLPCFLGIEGRGQDLGIGEGYGMAGLTVCRWRHAGSDFAGNFGLLAIK